MSILAAITAIVIAWIVIKNFDVMIVLLFYGVIAALILAVGLGAILLGIAIF